MKSILSIIAATLLTVGSKGQGIFANGPEHPTIEAGAGIILQDIGYRFTLGGKDLFLNNRLGVYYTVEYRGAQESEAVYQRDILGLTYSLHKNWAVRAGVGMFMKGLLDSENNGLRKEMTLTYQPSSMPVSFDVGYSFNVGPTTTVRYVIPLGGKQKVEAPTPVKEEVIAPVEEVVAPVEEEVAPVEEEVAPVEEVVAPVEEVVAPAEETKASPNQEVMRVASEISAHKFKLNDVLPGEKMKKDLAVIAEYLKSNSSASLSIIGHSCSVGSKDAKLRVSQERAQSVANFLKSAGVNADQLDVSWKSDSEKIGAGEVNRRVSITLR